MDTRNPIANGGPRSEVRFDFHARDPSSPLMRKFFTLLSREVRSYFYSPIAYIVLVFFLLVSGADFYFQISFMNGRAVPYSVQEAFFNSVFFWFAFVLIFPLITMRLFAEEFKLGTIEPLMTAPVRDWQVVLAKFFGALVFYIVLWMPTAALFHHLPGDHASAGRPARSAPISAAISCCCCSGCFIISVGCLASVLTKNQIIAAIISFCAITLHFFLRADFVHRARHQLGDAAIARLFLRHRTNGNALPRRNRYAPDGSLRQHDDRDADPHLSGVPNAEMEVVTMADRDSSAKPAQTPKKIHRLQIGLNVLVQVALILFLAAMVNYLGFEHYRRWDFSRDKKYALSDKTKRFLDSIKGKVRVTVFFAPNNPIASDVQNLLTEYQYAAKGKIDVEYVDPERNLSRAKELFDKYKVVSDESLVIVDYEGRNKTVKASEMAEMDQGNPMLGEAPKVTAFKGEQAITSAMMDLVEGKKNVLGYVIGHKEPPIRCSADLSADDTAGGRTQPDLGLANVHRERERQIPGAESVRGAGHSCGA